MVMLVFECIGSLQCSYMWSNTDHLDLAKYLESLSPHTGTIIRLWQVTRLDRNSAVATTIDTTCSGSVLVLRVQ